ncbi:MAG: hypothetical protein AAGC73_10070 [Verrucomicrobiota bacterium]
MKLSLFNPRLTRRSGFSLIEVVLALGVFLVTILALVGLIGPSLKSINEVETTDEISSVVNTLNAFLQNSQGIATSVDSKFNVIYNNVATGGEATVFVFKAYLDENSTNTRIRVGFAEVDPAVGDEDSVLLDDEDFRNAAGTIYRCVLTASSVLPSNTRTPNRNGDGIYTLTNDLATYTEGYLAMEVRIFAEEPPGPIGNFASTTNLPDLVDLDPIFTYNTAIVR